MYLQVCTRSSIILVLIVQVVYHRKVLFNYIHVRSVSVGLAPFLMLVLCRLSIIVFLTLLDFGEFLITHKPQLLVKVYQKAHCST